MGQLGDTLDIQPLHKLINKESKINRKVIKKDIVDIEKNIFFIERN